MLRKTRLGIFVIGIGLFHVLYRIPTNQSIRLVSAHTGSRSKVTTDDRYIFPTFITFTHRISNLENARLKKIERVHISR